MTKRQALMKLRHDGQFRICLYEDYMRLVRHLKHDIEYAQIAVEGYEPGIRAVLHNGLLFIPVTDEELTNFHYHPERA